MSNRIPQHDVTGQINLENPYAVAQAIDTVLGARYGAAWNRRLLWKAFNDVARAFRGDYPGLLACDTPYHDLHHTIDTALVMARLVDGYEARQAEEGHPLGPDLALAGVLLALFHDIGFLRRSGAEADLSGAALAPHHEARSVEFTKAYLMGTELAEYAPLAELIHATAFRQDPAALFDAYPAAHVWIGRMVGTADLLSQIADPFYIEKCHDFLYLEFVTGGLDRTQAPDGREIVLYASAEDLLRKTPGFFQGLVLKRLSDDFANAHRYLKIHFGGRDPYMAAAIASISYLKTVLAKNDFSTLRDPPPPLLAADIESAPLVEK